MNINKTTISMNITAVSGGPVIAAVSDLLPAAVVLRAFKRKTGNEVSPAKQVSYTDYGGKQ